MEEVDNIVKIIVVCSVGCWLVSLARWHACTNIVAREFVPQVANSFRECRFFGGSEVYPLEYGYSCSSTVRVRVTLALAKVYCTWLNVVYKRVDCILH